ncbi:PKD domain-containing protein [Aeoliella sp. SH292]|uniref:beta strand repeat-containing protein n=1 Tax=Aeoliella sp. SH292 TaxID=3454464 RepID=UPI003F991C76
MSRNRWPERPPHSSRSGKPRSAEELALRHLERRRVLNGTVPTILIAPTPASEGDTVTVSTDAAPGGGTQLDWSVSVDSVVIATSNQQLFEFTPPDDGNYTIDLVVTDPMGQSMATREIGVNNVAPTLTVVGDQTTQEGAPLVIENLGMISDPGFNNPDAGTTETFTYHINWGDGKVSAGNATIDQLGGPGVPTLASFDATHYYADNGIYTVEVTVGDGDGGTAMGTFKVTVGNVDPSLNVVGNQQVLEGAPLTIENLGTIMDPGFANPTKGTTETFSYSIDWGDGSPAVTGPATMDQIGFAGSPTMASFDGSHNYANAGNYTVTVKVTDDDGGMATKTFEVEVLSAAPTLTVAGDQATTEGTLLTIENIGSVSDPSFTPATDEITYTIDWGDGSTADAGTATIDQLGGIGMPTLASFDGAHTYADDGIYTVTITINDGDGNSAQDTLSVTVGNIAPTLTVPSDQAVLEGTPLVLSNIGQISDPGYSNINPPSTETFTYSINWGDGTAADTGNATIDQVGSEGVPTLASFDGSHTFADDGVYTVTVTVTDDNGGVASQSFTVTVGNVAPTLTVSPNQNVNEGSLLTLTNIGQISDPGYSNIDPPSSETFTYSINWGDGTAADTGNATIDQVGSEGVPTLASFDGAHTFADDGVYTVTVTVTDDNGGVASQSFTVTVGNVAPTLTVSPNQNVNEGSLLILTNIGQISDPGYSNIDPPSTETFTYSINWGDGTATDTGNATIDQVGSEGVPTLASFDGAHTFADDGVYTVTVTVTDDNGGVASQSFTVTVGNVAPTLTVSPNQTVNEGSLLTLTNIGQISDPGYSNIDPPSSETFTYSINWGDGTAADSGNATIDQLGSEGVPTLASFDGSHTFADDGVYTVTVTVTDDNGGVASQSFTVTVGNVAPTLTVSPNQNVNEGTLLTLTNIGQISDPGYSNIDPPSSETFTYSINWGDGTAADTGNATIDQVGSEGVPTLASFDGAHTFADDGVYTVTVTVTDDNGGVASQSFTVTVGNVAPTLTVSPNQNVNEGSLLTLTNIGQISDPGYSNIDPPSSETFTYSINWGDGTAADTGNATIDQIGSEGVPTLASFDGSHTFADDGVYTVTVTVTDDDGGVASQSFTVTIGNVAPTLTVSPNQTVNEGSLLTLINIGQISDPGYSNIDPPSSETFTYSINWGDGTAVDTGNATIDQLGSEGLPTLASFDGAHTFADDGVYTVTVTVTDDDGGTATQTFQVSVANVAPTLNVSPNQTVNEGSLLTLPSIGQISDPGYNNNALGSQETFTYTVNWGDDPFVVLTPQSATVDQIGSEGVATMASFDASHTYADNGTYTVTVTVMDDDGGVAVQTFTVTVNNVAPQLTGVDTPHVLDEGQQFSLADLGVGLSDPGFDGVVDSVTDPSSPAPISTETFTAASINWGDGTTTTPVSVVNRVSGSPGLTTKAGFDHADHAYADNGTYTVTVEFADDDGGMVSQTFTIVVNNVAPTLTLTGESFVINEGDTLNIPNLGTFTDPGYNNPNRPSGASNETFSYSINWGDGTPVETNVLPASLVNGGQGVLTAGSLADSHTYTDNDIDNTYTITVTLMDDDGGTHVQSFEITVMNVAPTLHGIAAIDITSGGTTTLTLTFSDPGADSFEILVAWGENQHLPLAERWVVEQVYAGPTPGTFVLQHKYDGPPNPNDISGDVPISVVIRDDDFHNPQTLAVGESNIMTVAVGQPGTDDAKFAIDTSADIPTVEFPALVEAVATFDYTSGNVQLAQTNNIESGGGDVSSSSERFFRLHVVLPDGRMLEGIRLPDGAMDDLSKLFARLPDNHYRIYMVRSDNQSERLVLDVVVRDHRPIDPSDASDGTRDRPPTEQGPKENQNPAAPDAPAGELPPLEEGELGEPAEPADDLFDDQSSVLPSEGEPTPGSPITKTARRVAAASAVAAAALVLDPKTDWAVRLDRAFAQADTRHWQRLRRRRPR